MTENPYASPVEVSTPPPFQNSPLYAETVRKAHINTEATIKMIGILYMLAGAVCVCASIAILTNGEDLWKSVLLLSLGVFQFPLGISIRKLKPWTRIFIGIFSGLGLLKFSIGTIINALALCATFGKKGAVVFSPKYQEIIAATPHVKRKTTPILWLALIVLFGLVVLIVIAAFFAPM